jgi:hypothetical protein
LDICIMDKMYRLEYRSLHTDFKSHGNWFESKKLIEDWVIELNKEYKEDLFHWIGEK